MSDDDKDTSVRVAVRIRPQIPRELIDMCRMCTEVTPGEPQIILGTDKAFTFDYVYDVHTDQVDVYSTCVERLIEGALKGYNATVLAYGQTGSGKTYTMGTGFDRDIEESFEGIIPRAVRHLFSGIQALQENPYDENGQYLGSIQFSVAAQFMELYNEEIIDLLDPFSKGRVFKIHEDNTGAISVSGVTIKPLQGPTDALRCLQQGALARTTASTNMNEQSSRSHAIFTILIRRQRVMPGEDGEDDLETLSSKFHFVDLAGSERLKRTGATGERAREGISINCGLLALGNVISALGDVTKKATHVPYRDSKLTRLLQDSLGGNSDSLLIACISPSDRDFCETLNTLKYANRARNIKNKVQINQDSSSRTISQLRAQIANLQMEILEYKQGKRSVDSEGNAQISDTSLENAMLLADNKRLQQRLKAMSETINTLTEKNTVLLSEKTIASWGDKGAENGDQSIAELVANYINEIEKLKAKLIESEQMYQQVKKQMSSSPQKNLRSNNSYVDEVVSENPTEIINLAKRELEKEREILMSRSLPGVSDDSQIAGDGDGSDNDSEDTDTESDDKAVELQDEINDIQSDIEIKTKLIEQLELSQKRMQVMKHHYEEKLAVLTARIASTQKERDQVLSNMNKSTIGMDPEQPSKIKKVRDDYEKKLSELQKELRKLQQAQKEHVRQQRALQAQDAQLKLLRSELSDLKQIKIKLMKKMSEENSRHKEEESRKQREIAQLRKEARKQTNMIKSLQAQGVAKDQVLKRKTEEVSALRKSQKNALSLKAQGRVPAKRINANYHPRQARLKWDEMQRIISKTARSKHAVIELERELERLMQEREQLSRDLAIIKRRQKLQNNPELDSEEDSIQANLNYIQENITQVQHSIMDLEEGKESATEQLSLQNMLESIKNVEEAKYLIEKLYTSSISQSCDVGVIQTRLKEKEALLTEVQQDSSIQQQLLQHVLARNPNLNDLYSDSNISNLNFLYATDASRNLDVTLNSITSTHSSRSTSPNNLEIDVQNTRTKVRKRAAHAQELLFGDVDTANGNGNNKQDMSQSVVQEGRSFVPLTRIPSAPGSLKGLLPVTYSRQNSLASPMVTRKFDPPPSSPKITRRPLPKPGLDENETPGSPIVYRRQVSREETDVFSRLGAGSFRDDLPGGSIRDFNGKAKTGSPLICTHVVEGHRSPVLAIKVYECNLFTGAAEGNLKVWDLRKNDSPACLPHQAPVVAVEYDMKTRTLFSASASFIKIWDLRESNIKPLKTLNCESPITALTLGASGNLYSACSDKVRFWDLRTFSCLGKLSGGLQSGIVMCITAWEGPGNTDFIATGSKDHYVKVFEVPTKSTNTVLPLLNLEPPHYDGVQALAVAKDAFGVDAELFSGSRDSGIKRWDLKNGELKQSLNNCHKSWVSGMCCNGDVLLSSCRGGIIRLWNVKNCDALAEMKTDSSINDITCSDNRIFTASGSGECRIWRFSSEDICNFTNRSSINKTNKK